MVFGECLALGNGNVESMVEAKALMEQMME